MDDLARRMDALSARLRLQTLITFGALAILVFAAGGADVVAKSLVAADGWTLRTRNVGGTLTDRIIAESDVDVAQLKVKNSNLVLEKQGTQPFAPAAGNEGALWYDDTSNALKYSNGSSWVSTSTGAVGAETWRLEHASATQLTLKALGYGGGTISIGGIAYGYSTEPVLANTGLAATTLYQIYAYWTGSTVGLEASTTAATAEQYGVYANKTGDVTRRFIGLVYTTTGSPGQFSADMVRSALNENGYAWMKRYVPASYQTYPTSSTTWVDMDATNLTRSGLFFDKERLRVWTAVMAYVTPVPLTKFCRLGVGFAGANLDDSERTVVINRGTGSGLPGSVVHSEAYVTVSGSGVKTAKTIHRTFSGYSAEWFVEIYAPASLGFQTIR